MLHIKEKWLRILNCYYILITSIFLCMYFYFSYKQHTALPVGIDPYGLSIATIIFSVTCLLYNATLLRIIKRSNIWLAYLIGYSLYGLASNSATEASLKSSSSLIFIFNTVIATVSSTAYGPMAAMLIIGFIGIVFAMTVAGYIPSTQLGRVGDAIVVFVRAAGITGLLFLFRDQYQKVSFRSSDNYIERYFVNNEVVKLLTDSISDGIVIIDQNNNIKSINLGALKLLQQNHKDVIDLDYKSVFKFQTLNREPIPTAKEPIGMALKEQKSSSHELLLSLQNNQELFVDLTVSPIINQQSQEQYGGVIIIRDVSKKKKEENARSEFISTASHEMRTPVAAIEGYLGLALNDKVSTIDNRARDYLEKAHASTQNLGRLFQDLLLSAKAEDGRLINHPRVVEMGGYLEQLTETLRFTAEKKGLLVDFTIGSSNARQGSMTGGKVIKPLYYAHIDPDRMQEAITNLFDNAVKYTEQGKVSIGLTGNNDVIQLFIQDTGPGIPAADIGHLFQKFYRVDNSATRTIGGTGLGLFICREIVELYKGRVWATSTPGKGSTFFINIPRLSSQKVDELQQKESLTNSVTSPLDNHSSVVQ